MAHSGSSRSMPLLQRIAGLVDAGQAGAALDLIGAAGRDGYLENARGVCLMRLGRIRHAIETFQGLVLKGGVQLDREQPAVFIANFATALLLDDNVRGCIGTLDELRRNDHPSVARLRGCIDRWRRALGIWDRLQFAVYGVVKRPVALDFQPGEVLLPADAAPGQVG